jgi:hypothetical protein
MHTLILAALAILALRALMRRKPADPMAGRIVSRPVSVQTAQATAEAWEDARAACDDVVHKGSMFESPDQQRRRLRS